MGDILLQNTFKHVLKKRIFMLKNIKLTKLSQINCFLHGQFGAVLKIMAEVAFILTVFKSFEDPVQKYEKL